MNIREPGPLLSCTRPELERTQIFLPNKRAEASTEAANILRGALEECNRYRQMNHYDMCHYGSFMLWMQPYGEAASTLILSNFRDASRDYDDATAQACWGCTTILTRRAHYEIETRADYEESTHDVNVAVQPHCILFGASSIYDAFLINGSTGRFIGATCIMDKNFRYNSPECATHASALLRSEAQVLALLCKEDEMLQQSFQYMQRLAEYDYPAAYFRDLPVPETWQKWFHEDCSDSLVRAFSTLNSYAVF